MIPAPLRPVERLPFHPDGDASAEPMILLRDPEGLARGAAQLSLAAASLAELFDGRLTVHELQSAFAARTGLTVPLARIRELARSLDALFFLDSPAFAAHRASEDEAFRAAPTRPAAHAGGAYAGGEAELRAQLARQFTAPGGPGRLPDFARGVPPPGRSRLRALVAPHIDLHRGATGYGWSYLHLWEQAADCDLFIVLGTSHAGPEEPFVLTRKAYETPFGVVPTDRDVVDALAGPGSAGRDYFRDEPLHRQEHSVEFQMVHLRWLFEGRRDIRAVPVLVGSFHEHVVRRRDPMDDRRVRTFVETLRGLLEAHRGRACLVVGADLAHVGRRFGDADPQTPAYVKRLEAHDRAMLAPLERGDAGGFFGYVTAEQDRRRICGLSPMYVAAAASGATHGQLLRYEQAVDRPDESTVSYCGYGLYDAPPPPAP